MVVISQLKTDLNTESEDEFISVGPWKYRVWWDAENSIGRMKVIADVVDEALARKIVKDEFKVMAEHPAPIDWLLDWSGMSHPPLVEARKVFIDGANNTVGGKIAMMGASAVVCSVFNLMNTIAPRQMQMKFFETEEIAIVWLRE